MLMLSAIIPWDLTIVPVKLLEMEMVKYVVVSTPYLNL